MAYFEILPYFVNHLHVSLLLRFGKFLSEFVFLQLLNIVLSFYWQIKFSQSSGHSIKQKDGYEPIIFAVCK